MWVLGGLTVVKLAASLAVAATVAVLISSLRHGKGKSGGLPSPPSHWLWGHIPTMAEGQKASGAARAVSPDCACAAAGGLVRHWEAIAIQCHAPLGGDRHRVPPHAPLQAGEVHVQTFARLGWELGSAVRLFSMNFLLLKMTVLKHPDLVKEVRRRCVGSHTGLPPPHPPTPPTTPRLPRWP
jgi:hypothetical protein